MFIPEVTAGSIVRFKLDSVVCPEKERIIANINDRLKVTGRVVFLSDAGERKSHFAVLEVKGIMSPLIVPVDRIEMIGLGAYEKAPEIASG